MTKEELKEYKYNKEYIKDRMDFVEEYSQNINKLTTTISDMPKAKNGLADSMAEKIAKLLDFVNEVMSEITELQNKQKAIILQLKKVRQPYRSILYKTYIQGKSLVTISNEMNYSYEYVKRMSAMALNEFNKYSKAPKSYWKLP